MRPPLLRLIVASLLVGLAGAPAALADCSWWRGSRPASTKAYGPGACTITISSPRSANCAALGTAAGAQNCEPGACAAWIQATCEKARDACLLPVIARKRECRPMTLVITGSQRKPSPIDCPIPPLTPGLPGLFPADELVAAVDGVAAEPSLDEWLQADPYRAAAQADCRTARELRAEANRASSGGNDPGRFREYVYDRRPPVWGASPMESAAAIDRELVALLKRISARDLAVFPARATPIANRLVESGAEGLRRTMLCIMAKETDGYFHHDALNPTSSALGVGQILQPTLKAFSTAPVIAELQRDGPLYQRLPCLPRAQLVVMLAVLAEKMREKRGTVGDWEARAKHDQVVRYYGENTEAYARPVHACTFCRDWKNADQGPPPRSCLQKAAPIRDGYRGKEPT